MDRNQQDSHVFRTTAATISEQIAESSAQWQQLPVTKSGDKPQVPRDQPHQEPWDSHCPWSSCKANHRERKTAITNCRNAPFTRVQVVRTVQKRTPGPACANSRNTAVLSCKDGEDACVGPVCCAVFIRDHFNGCGVQSNQNSS